MIAVRARVAVYRLLLPMSSARFAPRLAAVLPGLAAAWERAGRTEAALVCYKEALVVLRRLVSQHGSYEMQLALTLRALSLCLFRLGRHDEEIVVRGQAIEIYRRFVIVGEGSRGQLAQLLHDQAIAYSHARRREEAISAWDSAIGARRMLGAEAGVEQQACLAAALRWRSYVLAALHRYDESLPDIAAATEVYRRIAAVEPDSYLVQVAHSLGMTARQQFRSGHPELAEETLRVLREFAFDSGRADVHEACAEHFDLVDADVSRVADDALRE